LSYANSGSLWANDRKSEDNHPDRTGSALIGGREYWVNGWLKKSKDGKPYLSLSFKPKDERAATTSKSRRDDLDDEIPF
jgi:uncharacterized protein (DUF736 family)